MREESNQKNKRKEKILILVSTLVFMLLCVIIAGGATFYSFLSSLSKNVRENPNGVKPIAVKSKDDPVNILVMGLDIGNSGVKSDYDGKRTDTIILMHYNPKDEEVNMVSIPRDTLVKINGKNQKINAAHVLGGVPYLVSCVEQILDIKINYYGKVNYEGFREIVNILGGVDMTISQRMDYDDTAQNLHIHFKKGEVIHLDGKKAEEFFRWRENNDGTGLADGDLGRIKNQQLFIQKVMDKFKSVSIVTKLPDILKAIPKYTETNMDSENILKYGLAVSKVDKNKIKFSTIQGDAVYIDGVSYVVYDEKKNSDLLAVLHNETAGSTESALEKRELKVQILNGTNINGAAGEVTKKLKSLGYGSVSAANGKKAQVSTVTVFGVDKKYEDYIKNDIGINNIVYEQEQGSNYDIVVLLGDDYKK